MALAPIQPCLKLPPLFPDHAMSIFIKYLSLSQRFLVRFFRPHFFPFTCLNCSLMPRVVFVGDSADGLLVNVCYCREVN